MQNTFDVEQALGADFDFAWLGT